MSERFFLLPTVFQSNKRKKDKENQGKESRCYKKRKLPKLHGQDRLLTLHEWGCGLCCTDKVDAFAVWVRTPADATQTRSRLLCVDEAACRCCIVHIRRAVHCHLIERMRTAWCTLKRSTFVKILALTASLLLCTRKLFSCKPHVFWRIRLKKLFSSIKRKETRVQAKTSLKTCLFWNAWNSVAGYSWWGDLAGNLHVKGNLR